MLETGAVPQDKVQRLPTPAQGERKFSRLCSGEPRAEFVLQSEAQRQHEWKKKMTRKKNSRGCRPRWLYSHAMLCHSLTIPLPSLSPHLEGIEMQYRFQTPVTRRDHTGSVTALVSTVASVALLARHTSSGYRAIRPVLSQSNLVGGTCIPTICDMKARVSERCEAVAKVFLAAST